MSRTTKTKRPSFGWKLKKGVKRLFCIPSQPQPPDQELGINGGSLTTLSQIPKDNPPTTQNERPRSLGGDSETLYTNLQTDIEEIRIMSLLPGTWSSPIHIKLLTISLLDNYPPYEALSYVWEAEAGLTTITVNGLPYEITTNLFLALRRLRKRDEARLMWADAICIDQTNDSEKSHQVGFMGDIYRSCSRVYLWLGDYSNDSLLNLPPDTKTTDEFTSDKWFSPDYKPTKEEEQDEGFRALKIIYEMSHDKHAWDFSFYKKHGRWVRPSDLNVQYLNAFRRLMDSQWWNRLWVVQETILPREAITLYGSLATPWRIWTDAGAAYISHANGCCRDILGELEDEEVNALQKFRREVVRLNKTRPRNRNFRAELFHQVLWRFRNRACTDSRDMVYGLLGFTDLELIPDYTLSKETVFRQVTISSLEQDGNLNILMGQREQPTIEEGGLPSWIYDWAHPTDEFAWQDEHIRLLILYYRASLETSPKWRTEGEKRLLLDGVYIDRVISVGRCCDAALDVNIQTAIMREWYTLCLPLYPDPESPYPSTPTAKFPSSSHTEGWHNPFWRTLTGDITIRARNQPFINGRTLARGDEIFEQWWKVVKSGKRGEIYSVEDNLGFNMLVNTSVFGRRFFVTERGFVGLAGEGVKVGDEAWVFWGGDTPFLVRGVEGGGEAGGNERNERSREGEGVKRLVGDCYLHGFMDGEALENLDRDTRTVILE